MSHLHTTIIKKFGVHDKKMAPLFVAPPSSTDEEKIDSVVELACGHIVRTKNDGEGSGASFGIDGIFTNLSVFEAKYCPMCREGGMVADKVGGR